VTSAATAASFLEALREAANSRPVQASDHPDPTRVAVSIRRVGREHWVQELHKTGSLRFTPSPPTLIDPTSRSSELDEVPPLESSAFSALRSLTEVRSTGSDAAGRLWSSSVTPSAGGTHSIQPLLYLAYLDGGRWFRNVDDTIEQVDVPQRDSLVQDLTNAARAPLFGAILAVAEPDVLFARYPHGTSLLWRDAGAFCATTQFVAESHAMRSRIIGIAAELDSTDRSTPACIVGAVALSGRKGPRG
jgi:hypothetical protein